ncbi:hypothetical protein KI387_031663, partial [Taxus chinensis]
MVIYDISTSSEDCMDENERRYDNLSTPSRKIPPLLAATARAATASPPNTPKPNQKNNISNPSKPSSSAKRPRGTQEKKDAEPSSKNSNAANMETTETKSMSEKKGKQKVVTKAGKSGKKSGMLWNREDELVFLRCLEQFSHGGKGIDKPMAPVYDHVRTMFNDRFSNDQIYNKYRGLRTKFNDKVKGENFSFNNPHDQTVYELSLKVWGNMKDEAASKPVEEVTKERKPDEVEEEKKKQNKKKKKNTKAEEEEEEEEAKKLLVEEEEEQVKRKSEYLKMSPKKRQFEEVEMSLRKGEEGDDDGDEEEEQDDDDDDDNDNDDDVEEEEQDGDGVPKQSKDYDNHNNGSRMSPGSDSKKLSKLLHNKNTIMINNFKLEILKENEDIFNHLKENAKEMVMEALQNYLPPLTNTEAEVFEQKWRGQREVEREAVVKHLSLLQEEFQMQTTKLHPPA